MAITFFKIFVWVLLPPPLVLTALLLFPLPRAITNAVIQLCDSILFFKPHPNLDLSLFWICFGISLFTFGSCLNSMFERKAVYTAAKHAGGNTTEPLLKLLADERNVWISMAATVLWLVLHRYRSLLKSHNILQARLDDALGDKKVDEAKKDK